MAAFAVVVRIFSAYGIRGVGQHGLITGGVALD
jgi:hypothetical protein